MILPSRTGEPAASPVISPLILGAFDMPLSTRFHLGRLWHRSTRILLDLLGEAPGEALFEGLARAVVAALAAALAALGAIAGAVACARPAQPPPGPGTPTAAGAPTTTGPPPVAAELARASRGGRPVLFVGLDGGDWQLLDGYMADGTMPSLAQLVRQGSPGVLETIQPPLSPLVWTTMMTGVSPLEHRVLDFTRFNPVSGAREPIGSDERQVPAVWNMASAAGKSVAVFGLWATYPAEAVRGLMVADRFASFTASDRRPPPGVVFPPGRERWAREALAAAVRDTDYRAVHRFLPWLGAAEYERQLALPEPYAQPASALRRILAETRAYHTLARTWIERARPDLAVVYFQGTDTLGHIFASYAPPRQPGVTPEDFARYGAVPRLYFAEIDRLLGDFRDLAARQGSVLFVASDHGFHWREGRPPAAGGAGSAAAAAATAARWHREEGIYLLWEPPAGGPHRETRQAAGLANAADAPRAPEAPEAVARGGVAQVCATILRLLGLPPGAGLAPALDAAKRYTAAGTTAAAPPAGPSGALKPAEPVGAVDYRRFFQAGGAPRPRGPAGPAAAAPDDEQLSALRALGYIGAGEPSRREPAAGGPPGAGAAGSVPDATRTAASFDNEGLLLRQQGRSAAARDAFEQALARQPDLPAALWNLSDLLFAGAAAAAGGGADGFGERLDPARTASLDRADDLLLRALAGSLPGGVEHALERAARYGRGGARERGLALLERAAALRPGDPRPWLLHGRYRLEQQRCDAALEDFTRAIRLDPASAVAQASAGLALLCRGDEPAALAAFRRSLALDPNQPEVRRFLAHP
jgi:tetratricopeptide (TPR) repeat protein